MAFNKKIWKDEDVEFPNRFRLIPLGDGLYRLVREPGVITQQDILTKTEINRLEQGIYDNDQHTIKNDNPHGVTPEQIGAMTSEKAKAQLSMSILSSM